VERRNTEAKSKYVYQSHKTIMCGAEKKEKRQRLPFSDILGRF
jgi:hypothetical protein